MSQIVHSTSLLAQERHRAEELERRVEELATSNSFLEDEIKRRTSDEHAWPALSAQKQTRNTSSGMIALCSSPPHESQNS